ncbi:zinc ribbon domain-containing protein [Acinetobacter bereziniae]|uniref:zinc ribbon domain-containing protein n=1 Tax=Acinetobacter bereziniae TaxID=106648 RepID=UPI00300A28D7
MFCNQCGQKTIDNAKFCSDCGNKLVSDIETPPPIQTQKEIPSLSKKQIELWNPNAAANWSLLFTPVFGSYLQMKNWQALGNIKEAEKAKYWILITVFMVFFINFGASWMDAEPAKFSNDSKNWGLLYIIIWYFAYARKQPKYVKENLNDQYSKKSWLLPLISAICIIFIVIFLFSILLG